MSARSRPRWRGWSQLAHDLQRFNHILVPATKEERDRFRNSRVARALRWMAFFVGRFTEDGQMLGAFAEYEREMVKERTQAGLQAARAEKNSGRSHQ